jgi:hypothetical protein
MKAAVGLQWPGGPSTDVRAARLGSRWHWPALSGTGLPVRLVRKARHRQQLMFNCPWDRAHSSSISCGDQGAQ